MRRVGDVCKGSGRGSEKCEIRDFNQWCKDTGLFTKVDGHPGAFGCEIPFDNTDKIIQEAIKSYKYVQYKNFYEISK